MKKWLKESAKVAAVIILLLIVYTFTQYEKKLYLEQMPPNMPKEVHHE